jgi:hypothetical protein
LVTCLPSSRSFLSSSFMVFCLVRRCWSRWSFASSTSWTWGAIIFQFRFFWSIPLFFAFIHCSGFLGILWLDYEGPFRGLAGFRPAVEVALVQLEEPVLSSS